MLLLCFLFSQTVLCFTPELISKDAMCVCCLHNSCPNKFCCNIRRYVVNYGEECVDSEEEDCDPIVYTDQYYKDRNDAFINGESAFLDPTNDRLGGAKLISHSKWVDVDESGIHLTQTVTYFALVRSIEWPAVRMSSAPFQANILSHLDTLGMHCASPVTTYFPMFDCMINLCY